jgi:cell division protein FtsQ
VLALVLLIGVLAGAWMWLRDSSLVAVQRVRVAGASGPDAAQIRSALVTAARNMTTLDVRMNQLRMAVAPYPVVKSLVVATQFPHGMRIQVVEQVPVAIVLAGGRRIAVSGDGTLLHDAVPSTPLPTISLDRRRAPPGASAGGRSLPASGQGEPGLGDSRSRPRRPVAGGPGDLLR